MALCPSRTPAAHPGRRRADAGRDVPIAAPPAARWPRRCRAPHPAAVRCLRHGRLRRAPRRRRHAAGHAHRDRRGRRRPSLRRQRRPRPGGAHLHRRARPRRRRCHRHPGERRRATAPPSSSATARPSAGHIRTQGFDFRAGDTLLAAGRRLGPRELSLAAAMGYGELPVRRRPRVAVLATGDELVPPGSQPGPGQIIASNHLGVAALAEAAGAEAQPARHRPRHPREPRRPHRQGRRRRCDRHHRRRLGRRPRPGGAGAGGARHGAGVLEDRHAAGQAADVRPPRATPACWACRATRSRPSSARRVFLVPLIRALLGRPDAGQACSRRRAAVAAGGQRPAPALHAGDVQARRRRPARGHPGSLPGQLAAGARWRRPTACWSAPPHAPAAPRRQPCVDPAARLLSRDQRHRKQATCGTSREQLWCSRFVRWRPSCTVRPANGHAAGKPC